MIEHTLLILFFVFLGISVLCGYGLYRTARKMMTEVDDEN